MKSLRNIAYWSLMLLLVGLGLSLAGGQALRAKATAKLPSSARDTAATFTVSNANDSGDGSLRKAIQDANAMAGDDAITFATPFFSVARTITLTTGELAINSTLTINGPGANLLTISGNNASRVFNIGSGHTVSLSGMTLTNGNDVGLGGAGGGCIYNNGNLTVTNSTISGNTTTGDLGGGGIFNGGAVTVTNSTVSDNTATNGSSGGGITNAGTVTVTNSTISGNTASSRGGGILNTGGNTLTVTNSTISGNTANNGVTGGGIDNIGNLTVTNSTISGNRVPNGDNNGGGIRNSSGNATITNCTITNNAATGANSGGGVYRISGTVTIRSSIIAGNANNAAQPDAVGITSGGNNLIGNSGSVAVVGTDKVGMAASPLNPQLGPLQNNGGATPTHALLGGSPALNAGSNPNSLTTDQRGVPRVFGVSADIGAVEMQALIVTNTTDSLGAGTLRQAITDANANGPGLDDIIFGIPPFNSAQTINLLTALPDITSSVTINGPGANRLTISGNNASRVLTINGNVTVTLSGLTITGGNGEANFSTGNGGGIYLQSGNLTVSHCHIHGNTAGGSGGGIGTFGGTIHVSHSTINGNSAGVGGGLSLTETAGILTSNTISGNTASTGGGVSFRKVNPGESRLQITNSTIANNVSGGGLNVFGQQGSATATLRNTIIAGSTPNSLATETDGGGAATITSQGFNLTSDNSLQFINQSTDFVNTNPLLGPLQDNGGPTPTHALRFGSRALDAGHSSSTMTDQRGLPRRVDLATINNERDSDGADIGAYEAQSAPVQVTPTLAINDVSKAEGNSGTTPFDFTVTLSEASAQTVTVDYISGGGTASAGSDYAAVEGRLTFTPGQTSKTLTVQVNGDTTVEPDETFFVNLRTPTNATIAKAQGTGTIVNDDILSLIVQNTNDSGAGSLRQVIAEAPAGSVITFSPTVFNVVRTITLASEIQITKNLTINGTGANLLALSGNNVTRVVRVQGSNLNVTINDLTITRGSATSGIGGGILSNSVLTMKRCVIANNFATLSGGGVYLQPGATGIFTACTFTSNASTSGGALFVEGAGNDLMLSLANCTISGNTATTTGGALMHAAASGNSLTEITNCTIANNESADGGGIFLRATANGATPRATTRNSIYANNTNTNLRVLSENGGTATITSQGYNLTTGGGSGLLTATGDQINTNPSLGPLQNNGGPTPTHALLFGSPAIDKGNAPGIATDQRGVSRPVDDPLLLNATGGDGADIGAFERTAPAVVSAASFKGSPFAQESIVALFGENLTGGIAVASTVPLPITLDSTSVMVSDSAGTGRVAGLFFVSPGQLNFQIPPGTATGPATVSVVRNGNVVASTSVTIVGVEPALFTANASGTGIPAAVLYRVRNGNLTTESVATPIDLGPAGDAVVLVLYGEGIRKRTSLSAVTMKIGGISVAADFADAAPDFIGLDQINTAVLPRTLAGKGLVNLELTVDGKSANVVTLNFK